MYDSSMEINDKKQKKKKKVINNKQFKDSPSIKSSNKLKALENSGNDSTNYNDGILEPNQEYDRGKLLRKNNFV